MGLCFVERSLLHQGSSAAPGHALSSADAAPFLKCGQRANKRKGCSTSCEVRRGDGMKPSILLGGKGWSALRKETRAKWWVCVCLSEPLKALLPSNPVARGMGPTFRLWCRGRVGSLPHRGEGFPHPERGNQGLLCFRFAAIWIQRAAKPIPQHRAKHGPGDHDLFCKPK